MPSIDTRKKIMFAVVYSDDEGKTKSIWYSDKRKASGAAERLGPQVPSSARSRLKPGRRAQAFGATEHVPSTPRSDSPIRFIAAPDLSLTV